MSTQSSPKTIVKGLMVVFDIFDRQEIEKVNEKVSKTLALKPIVTKSHISEMGGGLKAYVSYHAVWKIESLSSLITVLTRICNEKDFSCNFKLLKKYVENFQVQGYDSPYFPAYVLVANVVLKKDALNSSSDLRKDLQQVALPLRLFIESLDGLTHYVSGWTPKATFITQLWLKLSKQDLKQIRETELALVKQHEHALETLEQGKTFSEALRRLEPLDLSASVGDVHSHILNGENVMVILGHMQQVALGGLRTPYILTLSYDESLFPSNLLESTSMWIGLPTHNVGDIIWKGYSCLIYLISLSIYLSYIALEGGRIDRKLSMLRSSISVKSSDHRIDQVYEHLAELSNYGTQISSLLGLLGTFGRQWEGSVRRISEGQSEFALEVPILPTDPIFLSGHTSFLGTLKSKGGYLETLSKQILHSLESNRESLEKQESEVAALRTHISDIVNLETSRTNLLMSKRIERLTWITVLLGIILATETLTRVLPMEPKLGQWILYVVIPLLLAILVVYIYVYRKK